MEIEVKLAVHDRDAVRGLIDAAEPERLAGFAPDAPTRDDDMLDRYLDTAPGDGALRSAGLRARLRVSSDGVVLAVKGRSSAGPDGVTTRMELEAPAVDDLDPARWPASSPQALVVETAAGKRLVEIAALRQRRHLRLLRRGDSVVELSLDELSALGPDGTAVAERAELEAELKAGLASALGELAQALATTRGLGPALGSKLDFALSARTGR